MTNGTISNQNSFIQRLTSRYANYQEPEKFIRSIHPESLVYDEIEKSSVKDVFITRAKIIHTQVIESSKENLGDTLRSLCDKFTKEQVMASKDKRFEEFGIKQWIEEYATLWDIEDGDKNIERAANTKVGITFADIALAESGTIVLLNEDGKGRSVSLLPEIHIVLVPASIIVPRLTQGIQKVSELSRIPSCVNFISGPSNSADIESYLVVGVHGPLEVIYIIIE